MVAIAANTTAVRPMERIDVNTAREKESSTNNLPTATADDNPVATTDKADVVTTDEIDTTDDTATDEHECTKKENTQTETECKKKEKRHLLDALAKKDLCLLHKKAKSHCKQSGLLDKLNKNDSLSHLFATESHCIKDPFDVSRAKQQTPSVVKFIKNRADIGCNDGIEIESHCEIADDIELDGGDELILPNEDIETCHDSTIEDIETEIEPIEIDDPCGCDDGSTLPELALMRRNSKKWYEQILDNPFMKFSRDHQWGIDNYTATLYENFDVIDTNKNGILDFFEILNYRQANVS